MEQALIDLVEYAKFIQVQMKLSQTSTTVLTVDQISMLGILA